MLRIGVDKDEVLAPLLEDVVTYVNARCGTCLELEHFTDYFGETLRAVLGDDVEWIVDEYLTEERLWNLQPIQDSQEGIFRLSEEAGLVIVSARPSRFAQVSSEWAEKHYAGCFSAKHYGMARTGNTKAGVCLKEELQVMIEDDPVHAVSCAKEGIHVIMPTYPWNECFRMEGVSKVPASWSAILEEIMQYKEQYA